MSDQQQRTSGSSTSAADTELAYAPIHALAERLRTGALSASALLEGYLERIRRLDGKLHAFVAVYADQARAAAEIADRAHKPGVAIGLAWTPHGGDILFIEAAFMKGTKALTLTGQLGNVMKESAQAALTYLRSNADALVAALA